VFAHDCDLRGDFIAAGLEFGFIGGGLTISTISTGIVHKVLGLGKTLVL
jgi:hypothetical protein